MDLHHMQLSAPAGCEPAARAFWQAIGFTEIAKPDALVARGGAWFRNGSAEVHIGVESSFRPAKKAHPAFVSSDLDALAARLANLGHEVEWDDLFPGRRRFYTHDPFGNRLEFLSPPS